MIGWPVFNFFIINVIRVNRDALLIIIWYCFNVAQGMSRWTVQQREINGMWMIFPMHGELDRWGLIALQSSVYWMSVCQSHMCCTQSKQSIRSWFRLLARYASIMKTFGNCEQDSSKTFIILSNCVLKKRRLSHHTCHSFYFSLAIAHYCSYCT